MTETPDFDIKAAHKYFSAQCFNQAWDLMDKTVRTPEEEEQMIRLNQASLWHWTQRDDCTPKNMSIGFWQASRIYALLGQAQDARKYAKLSLENSRDEDSFYKGYAYEALARAEKVAGDRAKMEAYLQKARQCAEEVSDPENRKMLEADLDSIAGK